MKKIVPIMLLSVLVLMVGCTKDYVVPPQPLTGSWVLTGAERQDSHGWYPFSTGLENGVFYFYNDGSAQFNNGHLNLNGNWFISTVSGGYYDENGYYYTDLHQSMEVHVSDYYSNSSVNLVFDDVSMHNDRFVATNYDGNGVDRYYFSRY